MKIQLSCVGRLKEEYFRAAEAEYLKRLRPYCQLEVREAKSEAALLASAGEGAHIYAWDERGDALTSEEFSRDILAAEEMRGGGAPVVFAIGSADGHSDELRRRARRILSFGSMTIGHRLVRLVALEQIYRGYKILRGEPYHRA